MVKGNKVVFKEEIIEKMNRGVSKNTVQEKTVMEVIEVYKYYIVVNSGGCKIRVNPHAIELAR